MKKRLVLKLVQLKVYAENMNICCSCMFLIIFWIASSQGVSSLVKPQKRCVPTAVVYSPCHTCVCMTDGLFHCRRERCHQGISRIRTKQEMQCEPNLMYREDTTFCTCSNTGQWRSTNCVVKFQYIESEKAPSLPKLRSYIKCVPDHLYLVECNICQCKANGYMDLAFCTNRQCRQGHKADSCNYGDILKSPTELCACSDINYYIDRFCLTIIDKPIQRISTENISSILDGNNPLLRTHAQCHRHTLYWIDCNKCICKSGILVCTDKLCIMSDFKDALREKQSKDRNKFFSLQEIEHIQRKCVPGLKYRVKCNSCICNLEGKPICTSMVCSVVNTRASVNVTKWKQSRNDLPEIKDNESCIAGKLYKSACNTCKCSDNNVLICTKMACLDKEDYKRITDFRTKIQSNKLRKGVDNKIHDYPDLPEGKCSPGKFYRKACKLCFCNEKMSPICSQEEEPCDESMYKRKVKTPEDIRTVPTDEEFETLPSLPHRAAKCDAGKTYKVDCNTCFCLADGNLLCGKMLCLSYDDVNRVHANTQSGTPCKDIAKSDNKCVKCVCRNETMKCNAVPGCIAEDRRQLHGAPHKDKPRLTLDIHRDKCLAGMIYKNDCNKCYCQKDSVLRCTQKTCLNRRQVLKLQKHRLFLEKNGL